MLPVIPWNVSYSKQSIFPVHRFWEFRSWTGWKAVHKKPLPPTAWWCLHSLNAPCFQFSCVSFQFFRNVNLLSLIQEKNRTSPDRCLDSVNIYIKAVTFLGGSFFKTQPMGYCSQTWVPACLPPQVSSAQNTDGRTRQIPTQTRTDQFSGIQISSNLGLNPIGPSAPRDDNSNSNGNNARQGLSGLWSKLRSTVNAFSAFMKGFGKWWGCLYALLIFMDYEGLRFYTNNLFIIIAQNF